MPLINLSEKYPPQLSEERGFALTSQIQDWQFSHGSLVKLIGPEAEQKALAYPIGVSVFPTPFPRTRFNQALELQSIFNELYCAIAEDEDWIHEAIRDLLPVDPLAAALWNIHEKVKRGGYVQDISVGIFRSDYMLHGRSGALKQVEFNTYSCAGGVHAKRAGDMHRYLAGTGAYNSPEQEDCEGLAIRLSALPLNENISSLASCLADAHSIYGKPKSQAASYTAVLFVVQPNNFNIADERPIEYNLWNRDTSVPTYRVEFGEDLENYTTLTESQELLFNPPWLGLTKPVEISVVYLRAGYESHEYDELGQRVREKVEKSRAIKCPSILSHITTFKKVQQALVAPGVLERFLPADKAAAVRSTFVPIFPLDGSDAGGHARRLALDSKLSANYILKPSLEGGGHNVFGANIPGFLSSIPQSHWGAYVLMERIPSPEISNVLMRPEGVDLGMVISELGIFGTCMWRKGTGENNSRLELLKNSVGGWSFKTKYEETDEMSVVKGYGCFDTPLLI